MKCGTCGKENKEKNKFCENCGTPLFKPPPREIKGSLISMRVIQPPSKKDIEKELDKAAVRWVLGDEIERLHSDEETGKLTPLPGPKHCDACIRFAGEYSNYAAMMEKTNGAVPGAFPDEWGDLEDEFDVILPFEKREFIGRACGAFCTCDLEFKIKGEWIPFREITQSLGIRIKLG